MKELEDAGEEKKVNETAKPQADILKGNRMPKWGMTIEFEAPNLINAELVVDIREEEIE